MYHFYFFSILLIIFFREGSKYSASTYSHLQAICCLRHEWEITYNVNIFFLNFRVRKLFACTRLYSAKPASARSEPLALKFSLLLFLFCFPHFPKCFPNILACCTKRNSYACPDCFSMIIQGMDLYFKRHDGQAVTCEEFLAAMFDANDVKFPTFPLW